MQSLQDLLPLWYVPHMWHTNAEHSRHNFSVPHTHTCLVFSQCRLPSSWAQWHADVWCAQREDVCQGWDMLQVVLRDSAAWGLRALYGYTVLHSAAFDLHAPRAAANGKAKALQVLRDLELLSVLQPILCEIPFSTVVWNALLEAAPTEIIQILIDLHFEININVYP